MRTSRRLVTAVIGASALLVVIAGVGSARSLSTQFMPIAATPTIPAGGVPPAPQVINPLIWPIPTDISQDKQAYLQAQATAEVQLSAMSTPVIHPTFVLPASCPIQVHPGVIYPFRFGPFKGGRNLVNDTDVRDTAGSPYTVYAGATDTDALQGVIIVIKHGDACADPRGMQSYIRDYLSPYRRGALSISGVEGNTIRFALPDGTTGRFSVVSGQYL